MARDLVTSTTNARRPGPRGGDRVRSTAHGLSKVDAALLGAALVILGERVNSASGDGSFRTLPAGLKSVSADQNFELSLSSLRNANAEVSLLSSLVSSVRKDVSEELSVSKTAQAVGEAYTSRTQLSDDLEQYLADAGKAVSATELGVDGGANVSGRSYIAEMENLESASQEFLNIMRQLFAEELDSVAERQQQKPAEEEQQEVAKEDAEKDPEGELEQEVADDGGLGSPWMGLLGLAGGGGGGGGGFGGGGGGFGIGGGVIDGYVSGATVFWDINSNFIMDANEAAYSTVTGADGSYSLNITSATGQIVVMDDGVDISTGGSVGMMAMSVANATDVTAAQITPLTMLAAQGIDESTIFQMLGITDTDNISLDSLDPVELLESGVDDDMTTGGLLLLQAQQLFAIVNAVVVLAEESGMSQADAISATLNALDEKLVKSDSFDIGSLVGQIEEGSQAETDANLAIQEILNAVVPDFSASASDLSSAIVKTNQVIGLELDTPTQAMGESARAAALITQNDLVTEFKAVGQMDPATASVAIADRLSASFSSVDAIKTNFQDVYKEQIAAQAESGGGIITSVDDITVLAGSGKLISVEDIIGNDRNTGEGDLRLISIGPAKMTWSDVPGVMTPRVSVLESGDNAHSYEVSVDTSFFSVGDYVKLDIGPIKVQTQYTADDTQLSVATKLVNKFGTMFPGDRKPPFSIELADDGSGTLVIQQDSQAELTKVKLMKGVDDSGADFTARIVDIAGEQFVQIDSAAAESGRLNYVVANDDGIGHGMVRLSIEPEFRGIAEPVGRTSTVTEDGLLSLAGQFELTGNYTAGVQEKLLFQLDSSMPDGFRLYDGETYTALTKNAAGTYPRIQIDADNPPSLAMPENYHGDISYGFGLSSRADTADGKVFTAKSATDSIPTSVTAAAEAPADQATLGIFVGDDTEISADLSGAIIPVVSGEPNINQTTRILLTGGDPNETHSVTFSNIPDGMTVTVGGEVVTLTFGTLTIEDVPIGTEVPIQFTASPELLGSQFGLTDPTDQIRAVVTGEERGPDGETVLASGQGQEVEFQFDIGASFGLNVSARALTVSDEDVAALLGSLDASVGDGAKLLTTITLDNEDVTLGRMTTVNDPSTFTAIDAVSVDNVIKDQESGDVTLTLSGVDADASNVTVTLTDSGGTAVTAAAVADNNGDWKVDLSGGTLIDGIVSVAVDMTDDAGKTASASTGFDLDTTTDLEDGTVLADAGYVVTVNGVGHLVPVTRVLNDDGTLTLTLKADSEDIAATYLEGIAVLPTTEHFKGTVTANVVFDATREITANGVTSVIPLASAEKGPLTVRFDPVPDGVESYNAPDEGLTATEDHSISLASLFLDSDTPIASYPDTGETLFYEVSSIPSTARLVDGSGLTGLTGDALQSAIADAPLIGRVVGDTIQLTVEQAQDAHLVVSADAHLDPSTINLAAFTREPSTGDESAKVSDSVGVEITAVADAPFLSYDADLQTRGLVNAENSVGGSYLSDLGLSDKAEISIPATVSLEDLDGSESLWVWITPYSYEVDDKGNVVGISDNAASADKDFAFSSASGEFYDVLDGDSDAFVVKGSDLDTVVVSRDASYQEINGFDGVFRLEAVSLEGAPATAEAAIAARSSGVEGIDYAIQTADLKVEFLQPATTPILTLVTDTVTYGDAIQIDLTVEQNPTDIVTVLATGVPTGSAFKDADGNPIGARAEVDGVWVFRSSDFGGTVTLKLPPGYDGSATPDFTAYAVDSLGLTSAASDTEVFSANIPTGPALADPIVIDLDGDGVDFVMRTETDSDGLPAPFFDIDGDGTLDRLTGWLSPTGDDAFLVALETDSAGNPILPVQIDGSYLFTEHLVQPASTNAAEDLVSFEITHGNGDGVLTTSELEAGLSRSPFLWFDRDSDGDVQSGELEVVGADFALNVSRFDDNVIVDGATGALVVASTLPGSVEGTYNSGPLSTAVVRDVFLPVAPPDSSSSVVGMTDPAVLSGDGYLEDNPDGFELKTALADPAAGDSWLDLFGPGAAEAIGSGTSVLLSVRAKNAGTYFNLSQGARLDGQPTDTWLTIWDGKSSGDTFDEFKLRMFVDDNVSGEVPLELRATVVYTEGTEVKESTVTRDLTVSIEAQAERPDVAVPENIIDGGSESDAGSLSVNLSEIVASSPDAGEAVEVVIRTTKATADLVDFELDGTTVQAIADPDAEVPVDGAADTRDYLYTFAGPIDGDLIAKVDQYAAGTFSFAMDVTTTDGDDTSTLSGLPFQFKVAPVAQQAQVSVSATPSSEADGSLAFSVDVASVDTDGSEFISQISLSFALTGGTIHPGTEADVSLVIGGESYAVTSTSAGNYSVTVPGDLAASGSLSGQLSLPSYFDGSVSVNASAVTVESSDLTVTATSDTVTDTALVAPVSDGLVVDGLTLTGTKLLGSQSVTLAAERDDQGEPLGVDLIQIETLDPDEAVNIEISDVPAEATLEYIGDGDSKLSFDPVAGVYTISGLTTATNADGLNFVEGLENYELTIPDLQTDFALDVRVATTDGAATASTAATGLIYIDAQPLFSPEFVDAVGETLGAATLNINEDGSGVLSGINVLVGNQLNPTGTEVQLSLDTNQVPVSLTASVLGSGTNLVPTTSAGIAVFTLTAAEIARGVEFSVDPNDAESENLSGAFGRAITLQAMTDYGVAGKKISNEFNAGVNVNPTVDGVAFKFSTTAPVDMTEDGPGVLIDSLFDFQDTSEIIDSLVVGQSSSLNLQLADGSLVSLADGPFEITALENVYLVPVLNANGASRVQLTANVRDAGENGAEGSSVSSQTTEILVNIAPDNDAPVAVDDDFKTDDTYIVFEDSGQTLFDVLKNDTDVDEGDILEVSEVRTNGPGSVSIDPDTGRIAYTPATDFHGTETISYTITDGVDSDTATLTVSVTSVDEPPKIIALGRQDFDEGTGPHTIDIMTDNVNEPDGDPVSLVAVSTDGPGTVSVDEFDMISYQPAADFAGLETLTFTVTDGTTPVSSSFEVAVKQDNPLTIWATENRQDPLDEAIVNDGRLDTDEGVLDVYVSVGGFSFSTPDGSQSAVVAVGGTGIVEGSEMLIDSGPHAGLYPATPGSAAGSFEFLVNGQDGTVDDFDATIKISKPDSGYGSRDLTVSTRIVDVDGNIVDEPFDISQVVFDIFSTIPPAPFVQPVSDFNIDVPDPETGTVSIELDDIVRVPGGNDSHVLEILGLPEGVLVEVDGKETGQTEISIRSSLEPRLEAGYRIAFQDWPNTTIRVPADVITGETLLSIGARVGTLDGLVGNPTGDSPSGLPQDGDPRYVYSRLVDAQINLGGVATPDDDLIVASGGADLNGGDGDDILTIDDRGEGRLDGGTGRDTLNLSRLSDDSAIVDLTQNLLVLNPSEASAQPSVRREVVNFETVVGTAGDDVIIGSEYDATSLTLRGGDGSDRIVGGKGDDLIDGGIGDDTLEGGEGADRFVVGPSSGTDTVTDFDYNSDSLVISGFGLTVSDLGVGNEDGTPPLTGGSLRLVRSDDGVWSVEVWLDQSAESPTASVSLVGLSDQDAETMRGRLGDDSEHSWITFSETLDIEGPYPEASNPDYGVDLGRIVGDTTGYVDEFFGAQNFGDEDDQISEALGVIADAKFESALIARFIGKNEEVEQQSMDLSAYAGLSGSLGDDVLVGLNQDSVLYGGDGGSDRLIGGLGDDILIASTGGSDDPLFEVDGLTGDNGEKVFAIDELTGGAGADVFAFVSADTVEAGLKNVHDVLVNDFNRDEGDRLLLVGYDDPNDVIIDEVDASTNTQKVSLEDGLTVMFDLSFAREFDTNFALRLADFDKFEG